MILDLTVRLCLGMVTPWGGDALARLRFNSAAGGPPGPTGAR